MNTLVMTAALMSTSALVVWARRERRSNARSSRRSRSISIAIWLVAATVGVGLALAVGLTQWSPPELFWVVTYWGLLAGLLIGGLATRAPAGRLVISGALFGFAGFSGASYSQGPCDYSMFFDCVPTAPAEWTIVVAAALVLAILLGAFPWGADSAARKARSRRPGQHARGVASGPELLQAIERNVGVAVVVHEITLGEPVTIAAVFLFGRFSEEVSAVGSTEADAWRNLAAMAVAWRNADDKHVPLWWGAGGA